MRCVRSAPGMGSGIARSIWSSQRSKRSLCHKCDGRGWIETGDDMVPSPDIELSEDGYPMWVTRLDPSDDRL